MAGSRIVGKTLANEGANVVVRHFLARILRHGYAPFEHAFESSPDGPDTEPMCGFIEDLRGEPGMK